VQGLAEVAELEKRVFEQCPMWTENDDFMVLTMAFPSGALNKVQLGASIAINGTCLTVRRAPHTCGRRWLPEAMMVYVRVDQDGGT
jgi:riboflavin synthase alpha subunit